MRKGLITIGVLLAILGVAALVSGIVPESFVVIGWGAFLIVAIVTYHWELGYNWESRGIEYPLFWAIVALHFLIHGGGRWSLDARIGHEI